jgi:glycosyltransferase involved in cell wall biosynthesis
MTLTWGLAVCTYNRGAVLLECLRLAFGQARAPAEAVIVDASPDWDRWRGEAEALAARHGIALRYEPARERSSATQRNQAVAAATADVLFLIDDDSFLFPDAAERIMAVYEADAAGAVAGVGLAASAENPATAPSGATRKQTGHDTAGGLLALPLVGGLARLFYRKVLMMQHEETFIAYATPHFPHLVVPSALAHLDIYAVNHISGYALTARRRVALAEPFDTALRYYAALEDADATHRYLRHGALVVARGARVHHFQTSASRLPRDRVIILQLLNLALFLRRHAADPALKRRQYRVMLRRRLVAEVFKDLLSRRWSLPQMRAVRYVMGLQDAVFDRPVDEIVAWYPDFQRRLIEAGDYVAFPPSGGSPASTRS